MLFISADVRYILWILEVTIYGKHHFSLKIFKLAPIIER